MQVAAEVGGQADVCCSSTRPQSALPSAASRARPDTQAQQSRPVSNPAAATVPLPQRLRQTPAAVGQRPRLRPLPSRPRSS